MTELSLNEQLAEILTNHGVGITIDSEFIHANLPLKIKLTARATYEEINSWISSRMDVMVITENGEKIIECFGDVKEYIDSAVTSNLQNFSTGALHPILAAFGDDSPDILNQITVEEWEIDSKVWTAYIGNLVPKTNNKNPSIRPPEQFFKAIESGIRSQALNNSLHWFRGYYLQYNDDIRATEFIMDNDDITTTNPLFSLIPTIPDTEYYSCRNFIILKRR